MIKSKIKKAIEHIEEVSEDCECVICHKLEHGTYLDGLRDALSNNF